MTYTFEPSRELYEHSMMKVALARKIAQESYSFPHMTSPFLDRITDAWDKFYTFQIRSQKSLQEDYAASREAVKQQKRFSNRNNVQKQQYLANTQIRAMMKRENAIGHSSYRSEQRR
jgi:hypothetical protein